MKGARALRGGAALAFAFLLCAVAAASAATATIVTAGKTRAIVYEPAGAPVGGVILVPGKSTKAPLGPDGSKLDGDGNFVIRTRQDYVDAGFTTAVAEDPSDLGPLIALLRTKARPVFLVATSNGTIVAAANATRLGAAGPDGLVLTSTVTKPSALFAKSAADYPLKDLRIPVLFVHNANDACRLSPPAGMERVAAALDPSLVTVVTVSSTAGNQDPDQCGAFAPHGYLGIEASVDARIIDWLKARAAAH